MVRILVLCVVLVAALAVDASAACGCRRGKSGCARRPVRNTAAWLLGK